MVQRTTCLSVYAKCIVYLVVPADPWIVRVEAPLTAALTVQKLHVYPETHIS